MTQRAQTVWLTAIVGFGLLVALAIGVFAGVHISTNYERLHEQRVAACRTLTNENALSLCLTRA